MARLQAEGVILPLTSPWASQILLGKKKVGSTGPCADYQKLNAMTHNYVHPVSRVQDCLNVMTGLKILSAMDILFAYNQLPMAERDIPKMAFTMRYGLFEFTTMTFGLMTTPATYQWLMEMGLSGLQ